MRFELTNSKDVTDFARLNSVPIRWPRGLIANTPCVGPKVQPAHTLLRAFPLAKTPRRQDMIDTPAIVALTASNAGPFTGGGTNTYLIGHQALAVIDPGPTDAEHLRAILAAAGNRPITHIVVTHAHRDHVDGLAALKRATGAVSLGFQRAERAGAPRIDMAASPSGGDFVDGDYAPDIVLEDRCIFQAGDVSLEAIHTPGHAPDHGCFALPSDTDGRPPVLFSGDHVMGWSTSVIAPPEGHMGDYLRSLERLVGRPETKYLPGHGAAILDGPRTARAYLIHRQMREQAVLTAVRQGAQTIPAIAAIVYDGLAATLWNAAHLSVLAHVDLLVEKGQLHFEPGTRHAEGIVAERPV